MFPKISLLSTGTTVRHLMNTNFKAVKSGDSLRVVIEAFNETHLDTLPVVDDGGKLVGVFPRRRVYQALLDNNTLDVSCAPYIVYSPRVNYADRLYDSVSLVEKVFNSPVGMVPVLDAQENLVGMIGKLEYLRETLGLTCKSHILLEAIFHAIHEGMLVLDNEGIVLNINHAAEEMFNIKLDDIRGRFLEHVFPDLKFHKNTYYEQRNLVLSIPVLVNQTEILDSSGERIGFIMTFLDERSESKSCFPR